MTMDVNIARLLLLGLVIAVAIVGYELGRSGEPQACPECSHCRDRRRDAEQRARDAAADEKRFQSALRRLALPGRDEPPIRVVRRGHSAGRVALEKLRKILVAYDGSDHSKRALDFGLALGAALDTRVSVVSVVPFHPSRIPIDPWDDEEVHAQELLDAQKAAARVGVNVELIEPVGEPADEIERTAETGDFDAILVGSSETPAWARWLGGSVPGRLASRGRRTVIVVR
jgi:nucleotide-binding universal stress UspA family protein